MGHHETLRELGRLAVEDIRSAGTRAELNEKARYWHGVCREVFRRLFSDEG